MGPDIGDHLLDEPRIPEGDLVRADMDIRPAERVENLVQQLPQDGFPLRGLHPEAHHALERTAMARHVDLGHQHDAPLAAEGVQFPHLSLRIELSRLPCHAFRGIELREPLAFQPPGLMLRQMQMEHIDLELRKYFHLPFQLLQTHIRAPHVHHPPPHPETRPVHDAAAGNPPFLRKLPERLPPVPQPLRRSCLDRNALAGNDEPVGLVFVERCLRNGIHQRLRDGGIGLHAPAGVLHLLGQRQ